MILTVGSKVVYPCQGPCLVGAVVERVVAGEPRRFYHLIVLDDSGGELFVPVDKVGAIGIRLLAQRSDIPKLLDHLMETTKVAKDRKQRANDILRLFTSGSAFDLAEIVGSLAELSKAKSLSPRESWTLVRARNLLICEISEVMGQTKSAVEEQVDQALRARIIAVVSGKPNYQPFGGLRHRYQAR
jgi:CarD family transcriptional regulator, regulator of rRNA transcription